MSTSLQWALIGFGVALAVYTFFVLRAGGPGLVRELWPGPESFMNLVLQLAYGSARA